MILHCSLYQVGCCSGNCVNVKDPVQISPTVTARVPDLTSEIALCVNMIRIDKSITAQLSLLENRVYVSN
jgi:hypothetical protein